MRSQRWRGTKKQHSLLGRAKSDHRDRFLRSCHHSSPPSISMSLRATLPRATATGKPLQNLAKGISACSAQGSIYAQCIMKAQFGEASAGVEKDICKQEFAAFKECVQEKVSLV